jgi:hypothetical protein
MKKNTAYINNVFKVVVCTLAFCMYVTPSHAQVFCGIGMTFSIDTTGGILYPKVESLIPNSPAERSGLEKGMFIKGVNGQNTENKRNEEILYLIKGDEGTEVSIFAAKQKYERPKEYKITRGVITKESGDVLADFYKVSDLAVKSLEKEGYTIIASYKALCGDKDISFDAEPGKSYYSKVFLLDLFNFAGTEACNISADISDDKDQNSTNLLKIEPIKVSGFDISQLYLEAAFQSKHKEVLHVKSHKLESPTTCREAYIVIYSKKN